MKPACQHVYPVFPWLSVWRWCVCQCVCECVFVHVFWSWVLLSWLKNSTMLFYLSWISSKSILCSKMWRRIRTKLKLPFAVILCFNFTIIIFNVILLALSQTQTQTLAREILLDTYVRDLYVLIRVELRSDISVCVCVWFFGPWIKLFLFISHSLFSLWYLTLDKKERIKKYN